MNLKPCSTCVHYDRIVVGDDSKKGRRGWCAKKSLYPYKEGPGQVFPLGVRRVAAGALAKPVIVTGTEVVAACGEYSAKP